MKNQIIYFALAGILRIFLMNSDLHNIIRDRIEVSTALNSWKRITEGVYLYNIGVDPYIGDLFHETPLGLIIFDSIQKHFSFYGLWLLFVIIDLITAYLLGITAKYYIKELIAYDEKNTPYVDKVNIHQDFASITATHGASTFYVSAAYLYNPYVIFNCVGLTTTVFTNFLLSLTLLSMVKHSKIICCLCIAFLTLQGFYPICLIIPGAICIIQNVKTNEKPESLLKIFILFSTILISLFFTSYFVMGNWSFLQNTIGFTLLVPDLRPNVGLYWYFFTEMFEHFRSLFIASFQINVSILFVVPLALRLHKNPMLLAFSYLAIDTIFKSYPCIGDVGFYLSLLPLWRHLFRHMQQGFFVGCFILFCTIFAPTVWHQWIYSRSANANFYFGVSLAFAIAQIFLLTDILFANVKREFAVQHGIMNQANGNKAKLLLE
ncbi:PREDICTED: phosphatidylinositol glycan anchor biosynthesis class U protein [Ceratosolen solmsi marchali]|uniref:Phosphatidylinositol glycan anchor biosynthesis class U protein n=1 Tax=Ceratosolen solmsi marchali TaxID=326594 RepID=A0AAJ6YJR1_9HYME|nr:PREDICTED: phosphatidylinositol glycan anchor biosynthesis class U protein [Ceratosolen solmsi marchali]